MSNQFFIDNSSSPAALWGERRIAGRGGKRVCRRLAGETAVGEAHLRGRKPERGGRA